MIRGHVEGATPPGPAPAATAAMAVTAITAPSSGKAEPAGQGRPPMTFAGGGLQGGAGGAGGGGRRAGLWLGPLLALLVLLLPLGLEADARRTAAIATLMAVWWLTEALPISATALVPLVAFPLAGVLTPAQVAAPYANPVIFLFMGGFLLALAMQRWGLHRRMALGIVAAVGTGAERLVLGFMVATAFLSMWISNTATAAMMVPVAAALCALLRPPGHQGTFAFGTALMLGIAYGATIGGVATLIGTPPNAILAAAAAEQLGRQIGFAEWMMVGVPVVLVMLPLTWLLLVRVLYRPAPLEAGAGALLQAERAGLGPMHRGERITAAVFALMAAGWIMREPKAFGDVVVPGLTSLVPGLEDSTIAIAGALLLFLAPAERRQPVLTWEDTRGLPWGVLLLFGGGLALARAFETSGLAAAIAGVVAALAAVPVWVMLLAAGALFLALSELASNTAVAAMAMPILAATALGLGVPALPLMAVGAIATSCAFMLPVGTPPNAIVFGSGLVTIPEMARAGIWLNLLALAVATAAGLWLAPLLR
jgi:solute carrier family 13 (sodium-dependent dicarboxylate transporter), member 2/3/5